MAGKVPTRKNGAILKLLSAMQNNQPVKFETLLKNHKTLINIALPPEKSTLLHLAVTAGKLAFVKMLVANGAKLDICDSHYFPPIQYAKKNSEIQKWLLLKGSPVVGCKELHLAAEKGDLKKMKMILKKSPKEIDNLDMLNRSPLFYAAIHQQKKAAEYLLTAGAESDYSDVYQCNIVEYATVRTIP